VGLVLSLPDHGEGVRGIFEAVVPLNDPGKVGEVFMKLMLS
jgi:hypothetical protein